MFPKNEKQFFFSIAKVIWCFHRLVELSLLKESLTYYIVISYLIKFFTITEFCPYNFNLIKLLVTQSLLLAIIFCFMVNVRLSATQYFMKSRLFEMV
jgi:hypothetical protein